jgi:hypothetical protein
MAMSARSEWLDQFKEGNAAGGHASEVEAIPYSAVSPSMISRRFPTPWRAEPIPGCYVTETPTDRRLACLYSRNNQAERQQAPDERRGAGDRRQRRAGCQSS